MPESYTGNEGNDAIAGGLDVMDGGENWAGTNGGWRAINKTRDMIANLKTWVVEQLASINLSWGAITGKPSTFPPSAHTHQRVEVGGNWFGWQGGSSWGTGDHVAIGSNLTVQGHIFVPNSSIASGSWTVAYIDGSGRLSRGASSERFKENIEIVDPLSLGDVFGDLYRFQMIGGDGSWKFGDIAERLAENPALAPFVVYETAPDGDGGFKSTGRPESIDFLMLQRVQIAQLRVLVADLTARLEELENR